MPIIEAEGISKLYPAASGKRALLGRGGIATWFRRRADAPAALAPLDLEIGAGEAVGIIGRNGSGKSTLLKLIAGVSAPSAGRLTVRGRVASLLELGAGFHPMLTGRENVYLNAGLLGMRHAQVDACFDAIVDFSEIGEFIDRTVDTYSSGMYVRLAFSVAIHTNPDVFLVDEVLSVGDEAFQRKCRARILALKAAGKTILFVSHDLGSVQALCDRVLLLDKGEVLTRGGASETINYYLRQIGAESGLHRIVSGDTEALFNHGRISLYHCQSEITAPLGIKMQFFSMGAYHESTGAEWRIENAAESGFHAVATLPRLPLRLFLHVSLEGSRLIVNFAWENLQPIDMDYVAIQCFFPTSFTRFYYGTDAQSFPEITAMDRQWSCVAHPRNDTERCDLFGADGGAVPVVLTLHDADTGARLQIDNTDYMTHARLVHVTEVIPSGARPLSPQRRQHGQLTIDPGQSLASIRDHHLARAATRQLALNGCRAQLDDGLIELMAGEVALTCGTQLHVQLRIAGLWIMSHDLRWGRVQVADGKVQSTGTSQRFPITMAWQLSVEDGGLRMEVVLAAESAIELEEYNVSIGLSSLYEEWMTPSESGKFPGVRPEGDKQGWRHLNHRYDTGTWIKAAGEGVPGILLSAEEILGSVHPTAIRTDSTQDTPVIQLLCSPGQQNGFALEAGRHRLFSGVLRVGERA